jgi:hypothetical protein
MMMENLVEWWLAGETEALGENMPQCHFARHKSHINWLGANPVRCRGKPASAMARPVSEFGSCEIIYLDLKVPPVHQIKLFIPQQ